MMTKDIEDAIRSIIREELDRLELRAFRESSANSILARHSMSKFKLNEPQANPQTHSSYSSPYSSRVPGGAFDHYMPKEGPLFDEICGSLDRLDPGETSCVKLEFTQGNAAFTPKYLSVVVQPLFPGDTHSSCYVGRATMQGVAQTFLGSPGKSVKDGDLENRNRAASHSDLWAAYQHVGWAYMRHDRPILLEVSNDGPTSVRVHASLLGNSVWQHGL